MHIQFYVIKVADKDKYIRIDDECFTLTSNIQKSQWYKNLSDAAEAMEKVNEAFRNYTEIKFELTRLSCIV